MNQPNETTSGDANLIEKMWRFFSSIKLTITLLLLLAAVCVIGTLVPQNQEPAMYVTKYGKALASVILSSRISDMFHSWWFQLMLCLLTMNVFICSYDRLSTTWKTILTKTPVYSKESFQKADYVEQLTIPSSAEKIIPAVQNYLQKHFNVVYTEQTEEETTLFAEKGRWSKIGAHIVHLGIILLLFGALIGSVFGYDGYMMLGEGDHSDKVMIDNGAHMVQLDFAVQCDSFTVEFYPSGMPKRYTSVLTLLKNGQPILTQDVEVNSPLRYEGVNFFQSTYGTMPPKEAVISALDKRTGKTSSAVVKMGEGFTLPDEKSIFTLMAFVPHMDSTDGTMHIDDVFVGYYQPSEGPVREVVLPLKMPAFDELRSDDVVFSIAGVKQDYYTGLQVTKDPGVGLVYVSFILLLLGCVVVFFIPFKRVCVRIRSNGENTDIDMVITSGKYKMALPQWNRQLKEDIEKLVTS